MCRTPTFVVSPFEEANSSAQPLPDPPRSRIEIVRGEPYGVEKMNIG
jgi:hypothetical protein